MSTEDDFRVAGSSQPERRGMAQTADASATTRKTETVATETVASLAQNARRAAARGDRDAALAIYRKLRGLDPDNPAWLIAIIQTCPHLGRNDLADAAMRKALHRAEFRPALTASDKDRANFQSWLANAPPDNALQRPPVVADEHKDVLIAEAPGSRTIVLFFTGLADRAVVPLPMFDRYLAALGVTAIYLKDWNRLLFNSGVQSLAADFDGTVEALKHLLAGMTCERLVVMGNSAGGYGALRYGLVLRAQAILTFSAPTNATPEFDDGRAVLLAKRLAKSCEPAALDFRALLRNSDHSPDIHLFYGADMPQDRMQALYLLDEKGVTLHPQAGVAQHAVLTDLVKSGALLPLLRRLVLTSESRV